MVLNLRGLLLAGRSRPRRPLAAGEDRIGDMLLWGERGIKTHIVRLI